MHKLAYFQTKQVEFTTAHCAPQQSQGLPFQAPCLDGTK